MSNATTEHDARAFTEDAVFTFDVTTATHRRILRRPANTESLRPAASRGSYTLPHLGPVVGAVKGNFHMVHDPRFVDRGVTRFSRPTGPRKRSA